MMEVNSLFTERDRDEIYAFFHTRDRWRDIVRYRTLEHGPVDTIFYGDSIFELWPTAEAFPELRIIAGHQGYPYLEEMQHNLYYYRNIRCDVSGYLRSVDALREILDRRAHDGTNRFFNDKIHFATDEFYGVEACNRRALRLAEFWQLYFEFVGSLYYRWGLPEEQEKFFRGNAIKLRTEFMQKQEGAQ